MKKYDYFQPESLKEAYDLMEKLRGHAHYIAGGTDIIVRIRQKAISPDALISLRSISDLTGIHHNGGLSLGSMTRFRDVERDATITQNYPALARAASLLASPQIRNVATVGGNICNSAPCADSVPPLMVMGARLILEGPGGQREMPMDNFFKGPGESCMEDVEILREIRVPDIRQQGMRTGTAFLKSGRVAQDLSIVSAAALVSMEGKVCRKCRLAAGSVAPVPLRLRRTESLLEGERISPDLLARIAEMAAQEVSPITDIRSTEDYRRTVAGVLIRRAIEEAIGQS